MDTWSKNTLITILVKSGYAECYAREILAMILFSEQEDEMITVDSSLREIVKRFGEPEYEYPDDFSFDSPEA